MPSTHSALICGRQVTIRGVNVDGSPWMCARDVVLALGYSNGHAKHLARTQVEREQRRPLRELDTSSRAQDIYVDEAALRHLASRRKEAPEFAKALLDWCERDLLPHLRGPSTKPTQPSAEPTQPSAEPTQPSAEAASPCSPRSPQTICTARCSV
jgi:prophage antirepressor-like protein